MNEAVPVFIKLSDIITESAEDEKIKLKEILNTRLYQILSCLSDNHTIQSKM